ncbi:hypothetical protein KUTeg_006920 [Tegillarca granosa]|uniref:C2H2-type domain-containing protein n=1 Tax=Tegillarca granosa TaxID=220873 RepID=A0ABQ9FER5_TEGGR|nr:hypothetical protein KUTeg_006920 [Tegillarca granosa]
MVRLGEESTIVHSQREDIMANNSNSDFQGEEEIQTVKYKSTDIVTNVVKLGLLCDQCDKVFKHQKDLTRHQKAKHSGVTFPCTTCGKTFPYVGDRTRHEKTCKPGVKAFDCNICGKRCATEGGLRRHQEVHQGTLKPTTKKAPKRKNEDPAPAVSKKKFVTSPKMKNPKKSFRCRKCVEVFDNRHDLWVHGMRQHYQVGGGLQPMPWGPNPAPWENENGTVDEALREVYETAEPIILEEHRPGPVVSTYNFPIDNGISIQQLMQFTEDIYRREQHAFRLNLVFGVILQNRETSSYRYFRPYNNYTVLDTPIYISRREDLRKLFSRLSGMDITTHLLRNRPDTKWIPVLLTNVVFTIYSTHYPLGSGILPDYLRNNHAIVPLEVNKNTGQKYEDSHCAFRCLAIHRGYDVKSLEGPAREYYNQWSKDDITFFKGISFYEFPKFEETFQVNLEVYSLHENEWAESIYKSMGRYTDTMYVNMYEHHLSYIKDFAGYAKKFQCQTCDRHFYRSNNLLKHQRICTNKTKYVFPGGFFKANESIFEKLEQFGIVVPETERIFPWFITYDMESMLERVSESSTERLVWTQKHVPISVSICSNVEGYTQPQCLVDPDQEQLTDAFINSLQTIAEEVKHLARAKWGWVLRKLDEVLETMTIDETKEKDDLDDEEEADKLGNKMNVNAVKTMINQMKMYVTQVPVLGFNSARYDLNLVKQKLARHLKMHESNSTFVVKQNNVYSCISSPTLKFLDITQFLAPGTSYSKFLKAYDVKEAKGYFPYEWLNDASKLESTSLPPHEAFHSSLKGENITMEEYEFCQSIWKDQNMTCFRDFLIWYNNLDVAPFVTAVERLQKFYTQRGIDLFKTAMSAPGIARQMLFKIAKEEGANFSLFSHLDEDLYHMFKNNIVGGPSIIFSRHQEAGKTQIRGGKLCQKIIGFDANALYLWAIDQEMPVGPFIRRKAPHFRPQQGFTVVEVWECDFKEYRRCHPKIEEFITGSRPTFYQKHKREVTEHQILEAVIKQELFGAVEVDIEVPEKWPTYFSHPTMSPYQYFQEMSPLFCTTDVPYEVIGEHMQQHVREHNLSTKPRQLLVGGMKGRNMLLATPLLKWYLQHGMVVTKIHQVVEYLPQACFKRFVSDMSEARRLGDIHPDKSIIADTMKPIGNSGYGSLIMDKTKHKDVVYVQDEGPACLLINQPLFRKMECIDAENQYYEAEMAKSRIKLDLPIQLGYFILQYAKLRMLQFYNDCLDIYIDRADFQYCEMDTDSAYLAISGKCIDDVIKPNMRSKYEEGLRGYCNDTEIKADATIHWFPRTCCKKHSKHDIRTAGLFKIEYEGEEMVSLCSKTYIVRKMVKDQQTEKETDEFKFSSKGVNKRNVQEPMNIFRNVLQSGIAATTTNRGFRVRNNTMYSYTQEKRGFSYFYCKRKVCDNGVDTEPLDLVLCPLSNKNQQKDGDIQEEEEAETEFELVNRRGNMAQQEKAETLNEKEHLETQINEEQMEVDDDINDFEMLELLVELAKESADE